MVVCFLVILENIALGTMPAYITALIISNNLFQIIFAIISSDNGVYQQPNQEKLHLNFECYNNWDF